MVYKNQGKILLTGVILAKENRADPHHLVVVRSGVDTEVNGVSKTRNGREADPSDESEEDFFDGVGPDAYENHSDYGFYEQRVCQLRHRTVRFIGSGLVFLRHRAAMRLDVAA